MLFKEICLLATVQQSIKCLWAAPHKVHLNDQTALKKKLKKKKACPSPPAALPCNLHMVRREGPSTIFSPPFKQILWRHILKTAENL